jgi:DNA-directed RNA polymerase I, II, and III subunit RPABC2
MSDNESDYYSESSDNEEEEVVKPVIKKPIVINAAKKFGNYEEDESDTDDSEPDDADAEEEEEEDDDIDQLGGAKDDPDEEYPDDAEIKEADDDDDIEIDEDGVAIEKQPAKQATKPKKVTQLVIADDEDDEDEYDEHYLQKFDAELNKNYIEEFHPECLNHNSDEVAKLTKLIRDENNIIVDPLHRTLPYLTKYEKARVLGQRAKQIETGSKPLVKVPENIIDGYVIAELELREKKIPFIIKRPIPGGAFEYWNLKDLENINF